MLNNWTAWRLNLAVNRDQELRLPGSMEVRDIRWEWRPITAFPWTDPLKETKADVEQVRACFNSPQQVCTRYGRDFYEIVDQIAEAKAYMVKKGVELKDWIPDAATGTKEDKDD